MLRAKPSAVGPGQPRGQEGGGPRRGGWHATGPGDPAGSRDRPEPLPPHRPSGMARRGCASWEAPEAASAARGKGLGADARAFPRHEHTARCAPARARRVLGA